MWWIIVAVVVFIYLLAWSMCRVAARADEQWERLVNELELPRKERDDP